MAQASQPALISRSWYHLWVRGFDTAGELRRAPLEFREIYNSAWLIERHGFRPPDAVRQERLQPAAMAA